MSIHTQKKLTLKQNDRMLNYGHQKIFTTTMLFYLCIYKFKKIQETHQFNLCAFLQLLNRKTITSIKLQ